MKEERDSLVQKLRPNIKQAKVTSNTSKVEAFQNKTLRPIIKFQHVLLIEIAKDYLFCKKYDFQNSSNEKLSNYLTNALKCDQIFQLQVIQSITALFTTFEFEYYLKNSKEIRKRITQICLERFHTNLSSFNEM